jgi:hypothetical protein
MALGLLFTGLGPSRTTVCGPPSARETTGIGEDGLGDESLSPVPDRFGKAGVNRIDAHCAPLPNDRVGVRPR